MLSEVRCLSLRTTAVDFGIFSQLRRVHFRRPSLTENPAREAVRTRRSENKQTRQNTTRTTNREGASALQRRISGGSARLGAVGVPDLGWAEDNKYIKIQMLVSLIFYICTSGSFSAVSTPISASSALSSLSASVASSKTDRKSEIYVTTENFFENGSNKRD